MGLSPLFRRRIQAKISIRQKGTQNGDPNLKDGGASDTAKALIMNISRSLA
jgi:hypothetical protein